MSTISASAARQSLPAQLDLVEAGEEVSITRHGRVIAVLVRPDVLAARRASTAWRSAEHIDALLMAARDRPLQRAGMSEAQTDDLAASIRADRTGR